MTKLFTLSGGHLFSIYDGCRAEGIEIVDVRHEQTAAFAAEGWAKVTREVGVCALTAGPGVTNGMSAIASASQNRSPMLVLGGRAPHFRWGQGSLQEIDHVPFVRPLVKLAATATETATRYPSLVDEAMRASISPPSGPTFLDFPLDHVFNEGEEPDERVRSASRAVARPWRGRTGDIAGGGAAARRRAAGDHGRHGLVLGPGRGRDADARGAAADSRVPQRPGAVVCPPTTSCASHARAARGLGRQMSRS